MKPLSGLRSPRRRGLKEGAWYYVRRRSIGVSGERTTTNFGSSICTSCVYTFELSSEWNSLTGSDNSINGATYCRDLAVFSSLTTDFSVLTVCFSGNFFYCRTATHSAERTSGWVQGWSPVQNVRGATRCSSGATMTATTPGHQ